MPRLFYLPLVPTRGFVKPKGNNNKEKQRRGEPSLLFPCSLECKTYGILFCFFHSNRTCSYQRNDCQSNRHIDKINRTGGRVLRFIRSGGTIRGIVGIAVRSRNRLQLFRQRSRKSSRFWFSKSGFLPLCHIPPWFSPAYFRNSPRTGTKFYPYH